MSAKPAWSDRAFAARVRMGGAQVWLVVEGKNNDVPFYEAIVSRSRSAAKVKIRPVAACSKLGARGEGKSAAIALHDRLRRSNKLTQPRKDGSMRTIMFALDRDRDHLLNRTKRSPNILYTEHADVEAEVFAHTNIAAVCCEATSISRDDARKFARHLGSPLHKLAAHWKEWLRLCLIAESCALRCGAKFSIISSVHAQGFGAPDPKALSALTTRVKSSVAAANLEARANWASSRASGTFARNESHTIVSGKHVAKYIEFRLREWASQKSLSIHGSHALHERIASSALSRLDLSGSWIDRWVAPIEAHLS